MLLILPFLVVMAAILTKILHHASFVNLDAAMYLQCAQMIVHGKVPYVDFVELNPPLIFYVSSLPVLFVNVSGMSPVLANSFFVFLLILYSIIGSFFVLRNKVQEREWTVLLPLLYGFLLLNPALFFHFGQREHLFVLAFLPFFFMRWLRRRDQKFNCAVSTIVGTLAGIGTCLKPPYFLIIPLALELYWLAIKAKAWQRIKDPEIVAALLVGLGYATFLLEIMPAAARTAYFTRWVPLVAKGYAAYSSPSWQLLLLIRHAGPGLGQMLPFVWMMIPVCAAAILLRSKNSLIMPLLLWTTAGYVIFVVQAKMWAYQTILMLSGYFGLVNLELALLSQWICDRQLWSTFRSRKSRSRESRSRKSRFQKSIEKSTISFAAYSIMLFVSLPAFINDSFITGFTGDTLRQAVLRYTKPKDRVLVVSADVAAAYPCFLQLDHLPASRYLWMYPIKMCEYLKQNCSADKLKYDLEEKRAMDEIYSDIKQNHPSLIAVADNHLIWDVRSISRLGETVPIVPIFEHDLGGNPDWYLFASLESYGFEDILKDYRPAGFCNGNLIWVRDSSPNQRSVSRNHK